MVLEEGKFGALKKKKILSQITVNKTSPQIFHNSIQNSRDM